MNEFLTLSLSGGGYKGLYSAHVLARLEEDLNCRIAQKFDLLAGTSIGGIIALALALEIPAKDIEQLFLQKGKEPIQVLKNFDMFSDQNTTKTYKMYINNLIPGGL